MALAKTMTLGLAKYANTCVHFSVKILTKHFNLNHHPRHNVDTAFTDGHQYFTDEHDHGSKKRQNTVNNHLDTFPANSQYVKSLSQKLGDGTISVAIIYRARLS